MPDLGTIWSVAVQTRDEGAFPRTCLSHDPNVYILGAAGWSIIRRRFKDDSGVTDRYFAPKAYCAIAE